MGSWNMLGEKLLQFYGMATTICVMLDGLKGEPWNVLGEKLNTDIQTHANDVDDTLTKDEFIEKGELMKFYERHQQMCKKVWILNKKEAEALFNCADATHTGIVSVKTYAATLRAWNIFYLADTNHDGKVSLQELASFLQKNGFVKTQEQEGINRSNVEMFKDFLWAVRGGRERSWYFPLVLPFRNDLDDELGAVVEEDWFTRDEFCKTVATWICAQLARVEDEKAAEMLKSLKEKAERLNTSEKDFGSASAFQIGQQLRVAAMHYELIQTQRYYAVNVFGLSLRLALERFAKLVLVRRGIPWQRLKGQSELSLQEIIRACGLDGADSKFQSMLGRCHTLPPLFSPGSTELRNLDRMRRMTNPCVHDNILEDFTARLPLGSAEQLWLLEQAGWLAEQTSQLLASMMQPQQENAASIASVRFPVPEPSHDYLGKQTVKRRRLK